jgi:hypothetical protein
MRRKGFDWRFTLTKFNIHLAVKRRVCMNPAHKYIVAKFCKGTNSMRKQTNVYLDDESREQGRVLADNMGLSFSAYLRALIRQQFTGLQQQQRNSK